MFEHTETPRASNQQGNHNFATTCRARNSTVGCEKHTQQPRQCPSSQAKSENTVPLSCLLRTMVLPGNFSSTLGLSFHEFQQHILTRHNGHSAVGGEWQLHACSSVSASLFSGHAGDLQGKGHTSREAVGLWAQIACGVYFLQASGVKAVKIKLLFKNVSDTKGTDPTDLLFLYFYWN